MPDSIYNKWQTYVSNDATSYHKLVEMSSFKDWEICTAPECLADAELMYAGQNLFAGDPFGYAERFLKKAIAVCERIIVEERWGFELCKNSFPLNRGETYRIMAYATGLLVGGRLRGEWLAQASEDYVAYTKGMGWRNQLVQNWYLTAVLSAFFAGDIDRARILLQNKKSFSAHLKLHEMLVEILAPTVTFPISKQSDLFGRFQSYFDGARGPESLLSECCDFWTKRIELSLLRQIVFENVGGCVDWNRVIDSVVE